jgi:hypothetical protein
MQRNELKILVLELLSCGDAWTSREVSDCLGIDIYHISRIKDTRQILLSKTVEEEEGSGQ